MLMADYLNIADVTNSGSRYAGTHTYRMGQYTRQDNNTPYDVQHRGKRLQLAYRKQTQDTTHHNQSTARILKTDYKE